MFLPWLIWKSQYTLPEVSIHTSLDKGEKNCNGSFTAVPLYPTKTMSLHSVCLMYMKVNLTVYHGPLGSLEESLSHRQAMAPAWSIANDPQASLQKGKNTLILKQHESSVFPLKSISLTRTYHLEA